ncbi:biotin/lipoyl-binding protein [Acinetobacter lwoffii]|uniref:Biotin/lipoyl-binding protein n=1 Tax=Acinetobacter lwoffii TaxID=28090 RepID=A0AAW8AY38_ACILW|nr:MULTISPECIES: biotin/lipoyl-binding protein [Acinetobacter]MDP1316795.1 biotin/lipoyl-binding protein [Acinetobacter lwoffii]MDP1371142.1 biotin/lipoyl-binding protein [Acinetobacter lwoffii]MDP1390585.1 biotin/lipoyl-binding protein [Acinetobacter lwoffii]MDP1448281.1 biotin/lipoyl-binding protein [Acinetobacter lwoffii]POU22187.1 RND transporter [Acinetobacter sp. ACNIH3]
MNEDQKLNDPVNEAASSSDTEKSPAQQVETKTEIENNATTSTEQQQAPEIAKKKKYLLLALIPVLLAVIAFGLWKSYQPAPLELQGRVEAETVQVATKVPSRIEEIYVEEGQRVKKGDVLVRLNSPEIQAKKQQAAAALQSALALQSTAERGSQEENIASLYANWQSLKAQQNLAKVSYERGANLFKEGVISRQRRDELYAASQSAAQMTEAAYQQYARAKRGSTSQQKSSADAQVDIAQAALDEANALEAETQLVAPVNGTVSKTYGKVSELVATAVPVVSLIEDQMWVSLNIREDQYAPFQKMSSIEGYIPALDKTATFKIKQISAEGEFATIKTTRQTGGYDVRSFKLHLVPAPAIPELRVGMSVLFKLKETR